MSTRTDVQVTDFTFSDEEGGFLSLFLFFYTGKVRENHENALKVLKMARAPDMVRVSFIMTRDNAREFLLSRMSLDAIYLQKSIPQLYKTCGKK